MTIKITPREWEAISAYLDGQLAQKERARLEAQLQASAELRSALDDLRNTRTVLRSQPRVRAPRNFTLTPQMVRGYGRRRSTPSLFPFMRLASAFAGLVFVLVLVADLFAGAPPVPTASMPQMSEIVMATEGASLQASLEAAPEARVMEAPAAEPSAADVMTESMTMMEAPIEAADSVEEPAGAEESAGAAEPAAEALGAFEASETVPPEIQGTLPAPVAQALPQEAAGESAETQPLLDEAARSVGGEADGQAEQENALDVPLSKTAQESRFPPLDRQTLRWLEVVLAVLALGFGAAAYFLRRSGGGA